MNGWPQVHYLEADEVQGMCPLEKTQFEAEYLYISDSGKGCDAQGQLKGQMDENNIYKMNESFLHQGFS